MKHLLIPVLFLMVMLNYACSDKDDDKLRKSIDCELLKEGLIFSHADTVEMEINKLSQNYPPRPSSNDPHGHEDNLNSIVAELNDQCAGFVAELGCYACLESYPLQSVINFTLDSAGVSVHRQVNLWTPEGEVMSYR